MADLPKNQRGNYLYQARQATIVPTSAPQAQADVNLEATPSNEAAQPDEELDLSFLDLPTEPVQADAEVVAQADEALDPEDAKFKKQFEKAFGIPVEDAIKQFAEVQAVRQQQAVDKQLSDLKKAWGVDDATVASRLTEVQARFAKYPQSLQASLDNPEGAQLIWAKLVMERGGQRQTPTTGLDRSSTTPGRGAKKMVTQAQLDALTPQEWAANSEQIAALYAAGRIQK
jgi:hypothetical protein